MPPEHWLQRECQSLLRGAASIVWNPLVSWNLALLIQVYPAACGVGERTLPLPLAKLHLALWSWLLSTRFMNRWAIFIIKCSSLPFFNGLTIHLSLLLGGHCPPTPIHNLRDKPSIAAAWRLLDPVMEDIFLSSNNDDSSDGGGGASQDSRNRGYCWWQLWRLCWGRGGDPPISWFECMLHDECRGN